MESNDKFAIIIHGPAAPGKSTLGRRLLRRLGRHPSELIILDHGWGEFEFRRRQHERYRDLRTPEVQTAEVVVVELSSGEIEVKENGKKVLSEQLGATCNAKEWMDILKEHQRVIRSFRLWAEWSVLAKRIRDDPRRNPLDVNDSTSYDR